MDPELVTRVHGGTHGHLASRAASAAKVPSVCICVHLWLKFLAFLRTAYCPPIKLRLPSGMLPTRTRDLAAARTARRAAKARKVLRRCRQMDAEHADGPETGMRVHGKNRTIESRVATATRWPLSHPRVRRASACIRVRPFLLGCPPHAAASEATVTGTRQPRPHAPGQTGSLTPGWRRSISPTGKTPCTRATPHLRRRPE